MNPNLDQAIAAARQALVISRSVRSDAEAVSLLDAALCDLLAALDAQPKAGEVWQYRANSTSRGKDWIDCRDEQIARQMEALGFEIRCLYAAPSAAPRVERYGDGVLVHWPEGVEQYVCVGDCVTGNLGAMAVPEAAALVQKWREQANAALRRSGTRNGNDMADRIDDMADELEAMLAAANKENTND